MSSPEDEHSQGSYHASSQEAAGGVLDDTASLRHATFGIAPGSEATESRPQPNTQFSQSTINNNNNYRGCAFALHISEAASYATAFWRVRCTTARPDG